MSAYAMSVPSHLPPIIDNRNENVYRMNLSHSTTTHSGMFKSLSRHSSCTSESTICSRKFSEFAMESSKTTGLSSKTRDNATNKNMMDIQVTSASVDPNSFVKTTINGTSLENAIQFDLSVNFNGRKYSARRSLPSFIKLRRNLIDELLHKPGKGKYANKGGAYMKPTHDGNVHLVYNACGDNETNVDVSEIIPELLPSKSSLHSTGEPLNARKVRSHSAFSQLDAPLSEAVLLPMGNTGHGFTMLHAVLRSHYCPAMERWLRSVSELVPPESSPAFARFLWEPLTGDDASHEVRMNREKELKRCGGGEERQRSLIRMKSSGSLTLHDIYEEDMEE
eukprot:CAMPEP_0172481122 /NCGR_PEP_ID=MMETSP1066-20121228/6751_1 /TAXON_ID=671091 /ORGANISM="Coscinodiscus wailesii, Strain CCMP2513" /LENGTH=335 /DNA_ID=CAMNT_0013243121 /DNA_START=43 /DNA_END=1050 /DNA_ORIENTATION=-